MVKLSNSEQAFAPTDTVSADEDAWLLPDGELFGCTPDLHNTCAEWLARNVIKVEPWQQKLLNEGRLHGRTVIERAGAILVRRGILAENEQTAVINGQSSFDPSSAQLETIKSNGFGMFDTIYGRAIPAEVYTDIANLMAKRAATLTDFDVASFVKDPFRKAIQVDHDYSEGSTKEEKVMATLAEGSRAGFSMKWFVEHPGTPVGGNALELEQRIIPLGDSQCCVVAKYVYTHDGLSRDLFYGRTTRITVSVMTTTEAKEVMSERLNAEINVGRPIKAFSISVSGNPDLLATSILTAASQQPTD